MFLSVEAMKRVVGEYHKRTGPHYHKKSISSHSLYVRFSRMHIANAIDGPITYEAEETVLCNLDVFT